MNSSFFVNHSIFHDIILSSKLKEGQKCIDTP